MRPYRFRNTPKEKEYEYYVEDSNEAVEEAKKLYQEFDKLHLDLKSNLISFRENLKKIKPLINQLRKASNDYLLSAYKKKIIKKEKSILEEIPVINLFVDETEDEVKYTKIDGFENKLELVKKINSEVKKEKRKIDSISSNIFDILRKGRLDRYENLIDHQATLLAERDLEEKVDLPSTFITWGSFLDKAYYYEPKQENKIEIPVINYDEKKLISMDVDKISAEYQKYFNKQKKNLYDNVYVPLLRWKKGSNEKLVQELRIKKHETTNGYIYILTNKAFPNYIKIGSTMKDPRIRAHELTGTGVPFPYEVKFKIMTKNCEILEKKVHTILEKKRVDLEREFFECSVEEAKKITEKVVEIGK